MKAEPQCSRNSVAFTSLWITATALALFAGKWIGQQIGLVFWPVPAPPPNGEIFAGVTFVIPRLIIIGFTIGIMTSALQALLLHEHGYRFAGQWISLTTLACGILPLPTRIVWELSRDMAVGPILAGVVLGLMQWTVLRRDFRAAEWWILANAIGGFFLFEAMTPNLIFDPGVIVFGLGYGVVTGITAGHLMKQSINQSVISYNHRRG